MSVKDKLYELRESLKLSQSALAERLGVTQQTVQKWENGTTLPTVNKLMTISNVFGISVDELLDGLDVRVTGKRAARSAFPLPDYGYQVKKGENIYSVNMKTEYVQSEAEGLDIAPYREIFMHVSELPLSEHRERLAEVLFDIVASCPMRADYKYVEPSEFGEINALCGEKPAASKLPDRKILLDKISGAWRGRVVGCMLGKSVEGVRHHELTDFLKKTSNYPMRRFIRRADFTIEDVKNYRFKFASHVYADQIDAMPADDDMNYTVIAQELIEARGADFTPFDALAMWLDRLRARAICTAESVAYRNGMTGFTPPTTAVYKNPFREYIGAQIRADYFGYVCVGDPTKAAELAFRDASISHVKNGIYGEMLMAAIIAAAATERDIRKVIRTGLQLIPQTSRLHEAVSGVLNGYEKGVKQAECFAAIHAAYDENSNYGWCHVIPNAMIVAASLLYGRGDFGKSICLAVETGFDTDCNGATVGSILGMLHGESAIGEEWKTPFRDTLHTNIFGLDTVSITNRIEMTMRHIDKLRNNMKEKT